MMQRDIIRLLKNSNFALLREIIGEIFAVYVLFYIVCFVHCLVFNTRVIVCIGQP